MQLSACSRIKARLFSKMKKFDKSLSVSRTTDSGLSASTNFRSFISLKMSAITTAGIDVLTLQLRMTSMRGKISLRGQFVKTGLNTSFQIWKILKNLVKVRAPNPECQTSILPYHQRYIEDVYLGIYVTEMGSNRIAAVVVSRKREVSKYLTVSGSKLLLVEQDH